MIAVQGVGGGKGVKPFMYNVLVTKGEGAGGGFPLPRWRFFGKFGYYRYRFFLCIIKFE